MTLCNRMYLICFATSSMLRTFQPAINAMLNIYVQEVVGLQLLIQKGLQINGQELYVNIIRNKL